MSCGCDTTQKYDIVAIPEWNAVHIYGPNETVKVNGVIYTSKGTFQHMINNVFPGMMPIPGHMEFNIGQNPVIMDYGLTRDVNTKFWNTIPFSECFNSMTCTVALPAAPPAPAPPQIIEAQAIANTNLQNVIPDPIITNPNISDTLTPPGPISETIDNFYNDEDDDDDAPPVDTSSMYLKPSMEMTMPDLNMGNIDTKHIIIGLAGVLTLILLFKK
jgi:hypothetical protein